MGGGEPALKSNRMNGRLTSTGEWEPLTQSTEILSSRQEVNKNILETTSDVRGFWSCSMPTSRVSLFSNCFAVLLYLLPPSSAPHCSSPLPLGMLRIENQITIDWGLGWGEQKPQQKFRQLAPFGEKPGRQEPAIVSVLGLEQNEGI